VETVAGRVIPLKYSWAMRSVFLNDLGLLNLLMPPMYDLGIVYDLYDF
jgi:hypothetical protein